MGTCTRTPTGRVKGEFSRPIRKRWLPQPPLFSDYRGPGTTVSENHAEEDPLLGRLICKLLLVAALSSTLCSTFPLHASAQEHGGDACVPSEQAEVAAVGNATHARLCSRFVLFISSSADGPVLCW